MTLKECMTLKEILPTTIFSVKLMHDCTSLPYERMFCCYKFFVVEREQIFEVRMSAEKKGFRLIQNVVFLNSSLL